MSIPIAKPYFTDAEEQAVAAVLRSGWVSSGPRTAEFESALANTIGVRHGIAVNSGTSALHLALLSCGIQPGDEVIVPAFTCVATLNPIEHIGAVPVLADIETERFGIDPARLEAAITPRTRAIVLVHLFGVAAHVEEILRIARERNLLLIEDAALGLGAEVNRRQAGSFGNAAFLSFHPRKMITTGEGGMVLTSSDEFAAAARALRNYGASVAALDRHKRALFDLPEYEIAGFNYKMTDIQAAVGVEQVRKLPAMIEHRRQIGHGYTAALQDLPWLRVPAEPPEHRHVYQSYVLLVDPEIRPALFRHLADRGVSTVQGAQAMPLTKYYRNKYGWQPSTFPEAVLADRGTICLPIYPQMTEAEQQVVIEAVRSYSAAATLESAAVKPT